MIRIRSFAYGTVAVAGLLLVGGAFAQERFGKTADDVNKKLVKLFGSGGFKGVASYGTGIVVSPQGHVLTVAGPLLDTQNLRVHLPDGRRYENLKVVGVEPLLDLALVKIPLKDGETVPYFDVTEAAKRPVAQPGDWVLGMSNQFQIATRDEPMTVQRGVVMAYTKLQGRRGVNEAPYTGDVYVVDAITNNPGGGGGALTTRKGELLGIVGKELKNSLTDTWINYAVPVQAKIEVTADDNKKETLSVVDFVEKTVRDGKWKRIEIAKAAGGAKAYHGIIMVPDVVERTPPYVDRVLAESPAAKAGLKPDDLIVYINGEQVGHIKTFNEIISKIPPNQKIAVEVRRGDKLRTIELELKEPQVKAPAPKSN